MLGDVTGLDRRQLWSVLQDREDGHAPYQGDPLAARSRGIAPDGDRRGVGGREQNILAMARDRQEQESERSVRVAAGTIGDRSAEAESCAGGHK